MADLEYKNNIGLVHLVARKCYGWTQALGVGMEYEDVFQECSMAYVTAQRGFDPEQGVKFSAYFSTAAFNQVRKAIGVMTGVKRLNDETRAALLKLKEENEERAMRGEKQLAQYMGLQVVSLSDYDTEDGENLLDGIAAETRTPEEIFASKEEWERLQDSLSPLARVMVDMLRQPPEPLLIELESQRAYCDHAIEEGFTDRAKRPDVSLKSISNFIQMISDVRREDLMLAESELLKAGAKL